MISRLHTTIARALMIAFMGILTACKSNSIEDSFSRTLAATIPSLPNGGDLKFEALTTVSWDTVYFFGPYTPLNIIESSIGSKAPEAVIKARIWERDDANLLVFTENKKMQFVSVVPRKIVDFSLPAGSIALKRSDAVFKLNSATHSLALVGTK